MKLFIKIFSLQNIIFILRVLFNKNKKYKIIKIIIEKLKYKIYIF